jgi:phosphatidylglycerophosphate synthase
MQALPPMTSRRTIARLGADILLSAVGLACLTATFGLAATRLLGLGIDFPLRAVTEFAVVAVIVGLLALRTREIGRFGAANRVTLLRVALIALVAACIGEAPGSALSWSIIGIVTLTLILDGVDGRLARRTQSMSAFGARFDMETDAALILILSVLCWRFGKAGSWILLAGALRYGFVLASQLLPWMQRPLPYSRRRQTVCILQSSFMLGVISPLFPVPASTLLAAGTLAMLVGSFAVDIHWLWSAQPEPGLTSPGAGPAGTDPASLRSS